MSIIAGHTGLLIAMWVAMVAIGLVALIRLVQGLGAHAKADMLAETVTRPLLLDALPLIILALLTTIDPTHLIALIWFYVAALLIVVRSLLQLIKKL